MSARETLRRLARITPLYPSGEEKAACLSRLAKAALPTADEVLELHETALFLRAWPDDETVLDAAESVLSGFAARRDVRRFRTALADSGVAGTTMQYAFSWPMAHWLARRDPAGARIAWADWETRARLDDVLIPLGQPAEMPGIDDETLSSEEWLANAQPDGVSDFATLVSRVAALRAAPPVRESFYNGLEVPVLRELEDGADSRTNGRGPHGEAYFHGEDMRRSRPDLKAGAVAPIPIHRLTAREGEAYIDLARAQMSVRIRELEAFDYGHAEDAWVADAGRGLAISIVGMQPERRLMPEALYSGLFVKNGLPVGYWLASALFGTAEIAYNIFPTFRGGEAAWIYSRLLALVHQFLGIESVTVPRYQIGFQNDEAIGSGAFWFYRKMGFEPIDDEVAAVLRVEEAKMRKNRRHRSSAATLRKLTMENLVFHIGEPRDDLVGVFPYANVGHAATRTLARYGGTSAASLRRVVRDAAERLGVAVTKADRPGISMWAPVVLALPEIRRWSPGTKRQLAEVFARKGGECEVEFVRAADSHRPFRRALQRLCLAWDAENA